MTPLETLAKYGLDSSVKAIKERLLCNENKRFSYSDFLIKWIKSVHGIGVQIPIDSDFRHAWEEIKDADLTLLCSLAEKGERYEKAVKNRLKPTNKDWKGGRLIDVLINEIIAEAEGETK